MSIESTLGEWKKKQFKPVYWIEGDEEYYNDKLLSFAEKNILTPDEAAFNMQVFYGKDAEWPELVNACSRHPMFADRQLVFLKEAQLMKDVDKLYNYISKPLDTTIFIVSFKEKKLDGKTKLAKLLKQSPNVTYILTKKIYDNQLPDWTTDVAKSKGFTLTNKALSLLVDHIGNDLNRIENEIEKLSVNLAGRNQITEDDIDKYVGISKEYNIFELQSALAKKDLSGAIKIIQFFESNPKAYPIQQVLPALYGFFSKCYMVLGAKSKDEKGVAIDLGISPYFVKDYLAATKVFGYEGIEKTILLLQEFNLKSIGIGDVGSSDAALLKELAVKMIR